MEVVLKSALSNCETDLPRQGENLNVLLVSEDLGFTNSAMELVKTAACSIRRKGSLFCALWDFDFLADPLLTHMAGAEVTAADMIVMAARASAETPDNVRAWLRLWLRNHAAAQAGLPPPFTAERRFDSASSYSSPQLEKAGRLGNIDVFVIAGSTFAGEELKRGIKGDLGRQSHELSGNEGDSIWPGQAAGEEEELSAARTACSGCQPAIWSREGKADKALAIDHILI